MSRYRDQVAAAVDAVTIRGPTRYAWLGRDSRPLPATIDAQLDDTERRRYLARCLREELYASFYVHGRPVPSRWGEPETLSTLPSLAAAMSGANAGRGSWEPGWTVQRLDREEVLVANDRLRMRVAAHDCRASVRALCEGAEVSVRLPKELPELSPGFYTAVSDAPFDLASPAVVRVYWSITATGAPEFVRELASRLNSTGVPFRLKVADHPSRFVRCDAAVLYLGDDAFRAVHTTLREVAAALRRRLRPRIPALTLELVPGVGLAEDGADGESFGVRRCGQLAAGIVEADELGITDTPGRLTVVAARLAKDGVQIDAPYLEPSLAGRHVL